MISARQGRESETYTHTVKLTAHRVPGINLPRRVQHDHWPASLGAAAASEVRSNRFALEYSS